MREGSCWGHTAPPPPSGQHAATDYACELLPKATTTCLSPREISDIFLNTRYQSLTAFNRSSSQCVGVGYKQGKLLASGLYRERRWGALKAHCTRAAVSQRPGERDYWKTCSSNGPLWRLSSMAVPHTCQHRILLPKDMCHRGLWFVCLWSPL